MMKQKISLLPSWLTFAAAFLFLLTAAQLRAQNEPGNTLPEIIAPSKAPAAAPSQAKPASQAPTLATPAKPASIIPSAIPSAGAAAPTPDRALAYYHLGLADIDEEEATELNRPELITRAVEEYKLALNADPGSPELNNALADLYFRTNRVHEAESTARSLLKTSPNNIDAHKLLGRIYLRQLGDGSNAVSSTSPAGNVLDLTIAEYEKIVASSTPSSMRPRRPKISSGSRNPSSPNRKKWCLTSPASMPKAATSPMRSRSLRLSR
jgi:tetratricopeptide (TPR) repeat protein